MKDNVVAAAVLGVIAGYMIHHYWAQLEWFARVIVG
jgi:hypothetical protein